jgi:hypothetical protein
VDIPAQVKDVGTLVRADGRRSEGTNASPGNHPASHDLRREQ